MRSEMEEVEVIDPENSDKLWGILEQRASKKLYEFSSSVNETGIRLEEFTAKRYRDGIGIEVWRKYYRFVRAETGTVLYDQLEDVTRAFVSNMDGSARIIPDIAISPDRANSLMVAALEQQAEIDELIAGAR